MENLSTQWLHSDVDLDCPNCHFTFWVRMSEIIVQTVVLCPCCRIRVHLQDDHGGMSLAGRTIENLIADALKGLL